MLRRSLALAAILVSAASAQDFKPKQSSIPQSQVDEAIAKGLEWLLSEQGGLSKLPQNTFSSQHTGVITLEEFYFYVMIHAGLKRDHPVFQSYLKLIVDREPSKTYGVSLAAMCLAELDPIGYQWRLADYAQFLIDNQCKNGQWGYGKPVKLPARKVKRVEDHTSGALYGTEIREGAKVQKIKIKPREFSSQEGDNSNSQYASLGLLACSLGQVAVDKSSLQNALLCWRKEQMKDGGWIYRKQWGGKSTGAMTAGGVGSLVIYHHLLDVGWKKDPSIKAGVEWLAKNFDVTKHPGETISTEGGTDYDGNAVGPAPEGGWGHFYYLYALQRAGMLYGTDYFGKHDWYDLGADWLLKNRSPEKAWRAKNPYPIDTGFAILFLRRATKALEDVATRSASK